MRFLFLLCFLSFSLLVLSHEGHHQAKISEMVLSEKTVSWIQWIGGYHLILLHFPIALINMVAVAEILWVRGRKPIFEFASRFMLTAAAIIILPTAILGFVYSFSSVYSGIMKTYLLWHMWLGIATALLAIATAYIREFKGALNLYYMSLFLLIIMLNTTALLGGWMTFGMR